MLNRLSKVIISSYEDNYRTPDKANSFLFTIMIIYIIYGLTDFYISMASRILKEMAHVDSISSFMFLNGAPVLYIISISIFIFNCRYFLRMWSLSSLHILLPNSKEREEEIIAFIGHTRNTPEQDNVYNMKKIERPKYEELDTWVERWGKSRSFKYLAFRHCEKLGGLYSAALIQWSYYIPIERLNENQRLSLLKINGLHCYFSSDAISVINNIEYLFSDYSVKQIMTLFDSNFSSDSYVYYLKDYATRTESPKKLPIFNLIRDLINYTKSSQYHDMEVPVEKFPLEGVCDLGNVVYLNDYSKITTAGNLFSNCATSYIRKCYSREYYLYMITGVKDIMFHVDRNGKLLECKYKANSVLDSNTKKILIDYIKEKTS